MACADVAAFLAVDLNKIVKTIAVVSEKEDGSKTFALLLLRADHELNEIKANKLPALSPFRFATEDEVKAQLACKPGFIGPVAIDCAKIAVFADRSVANMSDFICGANEAGFHFTGVNFGRDLPEPVIADLRNVVAGDPSPDGKGELGICRGIEVGHIFQLRQKYAEALNCSYLDENGKSQIMEMGCYGIGVSRIVGSAIEQGNDDKGIVLPAAIAPFEVCIVPMGYFKSDAVKAAADQLYADLKAAGIDVVLDDRNERPGVMFADMELVGIPHRIVIGERGLKDGQFEYKSRQDAEASMIAQSEALALIKGKLCTG
jgi:prolyl-tRNA synthetase